MVELLAVIVLLGVFSVFLIAGYSRYVDSARKEKERENKNNAAVATELYLQANPDMLPQNIGEATRVPISVLKSGNYLKDDILNSKGESCMENSVVRVYKFDSHDYSYTTFLYCGDDVVPLEDEVLVPVVTNFEFSDKKSKSGKGDLTDVRLAEFSFTMKGAGSDDTVGIYSYRYVILVKNRTDVEYEEIFNSGYLKGGLEPTIKVSSKSLKDYIDLTGYTMFLVHIDVLNEQGGKLEFSSDSVTTDGFEDTVAPVCGHIYGDDKENNNWINKASYASGTITSALGERIYPGRITVECSDGFGSGCKREMFTKTWPNDDVSDSGKVNYQYGARWGYVEISDNAINGRNGNNTTKCYVRVNVDLQSPEVTLYAYNAKSYENDRKKPDAGAVGYAKAQDDVQINGTTPEATILSNSYKNVQGTSEEKWLNAEYYPEGIILDAVVSDNLYLDYWTWEVNDTYIPGGSSNELIMSSYSIQNSENESISTGKFSKKVSNQKVTNEDEFIKEETGDQNGSINGLKLTLEGKRYGRLTVYDKAGNKTIIHVYANIDRSAPSVPVVSYLKQKTKDAYAPADKNNFTDHNHWSNEKIIAYIAGQKIDNTSSSFINELSGWDKFVYRLRLQSNKRNQWLEDDISSSLTTYDFGLGIGVNDEGTHKLSFQSCDKAGNCSKWSEEDYLKIDLTKPTCDVKVTYNESKPNTNGWLKENESVTLAHTCQETDDIYSSGCNNNHEENKKTYTYREDINTTKAGVGGDNFGGYVYDNAGNRSDECPKNITVKIDTVKPTCTVKENYVGTKSLPSSGWLKIGQSVTLSHNCSDASLNGVRSGCDQNHSKNQQSYKYDMDINTNEAGALGIGKGGTVMDIAGNESEECPLQTVKIDHSAPTCETSISYPEGEPTSEGWLGIGKTAVVSQVCMEQEINGVSSGCLGEVKSYTYKSEVNTSSAGAGGNNKTGGKVYDVAGNSSAECPMDQTVRIDYTAPVCSSKATLDSVNGSSYTSGKWVNHSIFITPVCTDGGSVRSGCRSVSSDSYESDIDTSVAFQYAENLSSMGSPNARVYDKANNYSDCHDQYVVRVDKTAPVASCSVVGSYTNDQNSQMEIDNKSYDPVVNGASSGIKTTSYSLDGSGYSSVKSKKLGCYTNERDATGSISLVDEAGNKTQDACTGSITVPGCCSKETDWIDGTVCSSVCGGGTYNRYKNSIYNGLQCSKEDSGGSSCNTFNCCDNTYDNGSSSCSVSCGTGTKSIYEYSTYTNEYCGVRTESCYAGSCKEDVPDGSKCGMWISYRVGDTVYFTSNGVCDISSVSGASWGGGSQVWANCNPKCTVSVKWTSGKYTWAGKDYTYTSWTTLKCTGIQYAFCTSSCPSYGCVK